IHSRIFQILSPARYRGGDRRLVTKPRKRCEMKVLAGVLLAAVFLSMLSFGASGSRDSLTVHEWGTFTSVADANGNPVPWAPLFGPPDLPCFVARDSEVYKGFLSGLVRMETPVLYFYSPQAQTLSVHVGFPQGRITEWYPKADVKPG